MSEPSALKPGTWRGWHLTLGWIAGVLATLLATLAGAWGVAHTAWATQHLLTAMAGFGVRIVAPQGALLGDFRAERLEIDLPRGGLLSIDKPSWQGLSLVPDLTVAWWLGVRAQGLQANGLQLTWVSGTQASDAQTAPQDVSLPLSLHIKRVQVGSFQSNLTGGMPLRSLDASVLLNDGGLFSQHRVRIQHLAWDRWRLQGQASVEVRGRMSLSAKMRASGVVAADLQSEMDVSVSGTLTDLAVQAQVGVRRADQTAQTSKLAAQVQPFARWPVSRLKAELEGLDLANLRTGLPRTALYGAVNMALHGDGVSALQGQLDVHNRQSGPWDDGRLPLRSWRGSWVLARPLEARSLETVLASLSVDWQLALPRVRADESASLNLKGNWAQDRGLQLAWTNLEPQALYSLAPALQLQGEATLQPLAASVGRVATWRDTQATLVARLTGEHGPRFALPQHVGAMPAVQRRVRAKMEARYAPGVVNVARLSLESGDAIAELSDVQWRWSATQNLVASGEATAASGQPHSPPSHSRAADPVWQASGQLSVRQFDPQLWLPWPKDVVGRHALSARARFELDAAWHGKLTAQLEPSWVAGVPLQGEVLWQSPRQRQVMSLDLSLDLAGNRAMARAQLPWHIDVMGRPQLSAPAQWQTQVNASNLQALQPLAAMVGSRQIAGDVSLKAQGQGLWPRMSTAGHARVAGLRWLPQTGEGVSMASAQADWDVDARTPESTMRAQMDVSQLRFPDVALSSGRVDVRGSVRDHQVHVQATVVRDGATSTSPPVDDVAPQGSEAQRVTADLLLQGGMKWRDADREWRGRIEEFVVRLGETPGREALRVQKTPLHWQQQARAERVAVGATQVSLMGALLHLREATWKWDDRARDPVGVAKLDVALEAFNLPELLKRWQPKAGWGGDLVLEGGMTLTHQRTAPWVVSANVQRKSGDISLSEPTIEGNSAQRLGIRDARLNLQAREGVWTLTQAFEGRSLGKLVGRQVVRAANPMVGPQASDPLLGELDLSIGNLRPWATWIPAGWRISGQLQAKAALDGTLGAPRYSGRVLGDNLGAGQALLGVNLSDGKLRMSLMGDLMVLEHFEARGGSAGGLITAQGQATFGDLPQARMSVKADQFPLLQRVDRRVVISGLVNGALGAETMEAEGRVLVDEGLIDITKSSAPVVGEDVTVVNRPLNTLSVGQANGNGAAGGPQRDPKRKVAVNLEVDLGEKLRIKGMGLDAKLTGQVKVTTPANRPTLNGTIKVQDGTFAAYGQKLLVSRGKLSFTGPIENPRLDILAMRPQSPMASSSDVKVGVAITGTAQDPRIRLYSEPAMAETEKLSWLVLGRAPTGLGGADIGLLQTAAVALLSGEGASPSDNLIGKLGLDEFSVRQTDGTVRETVVNVGKQVSRYWYVGYERNLNATSGNWQMIYTLARSFTLRLQAGVDNAADLIWSWRWD